jgi:LuxR family transcriptional regulator, maltose regulon positive regulatory protein
MKINLKTNDIGQEGGIPSQQIAKITRPDVQCAIPRKRLFALLDNARQKPVVWITAPAGSGKTTLVASYLEAGSLPFLWYQVDEGDADPAAFFYYMGLAVSSADPGTKKSLPLLTPEYRQGITTFSRRYFEDLFARLAGVKRPGAMSPSCFFVFDNYQEVPAESEFHQILAQALDVIPPGINVAIISRHGPPPRFARLRANNRLNVIGWDDVRFTLDETKELIKADAQPACALSLHEITGGWAAGLVLFAGRCKSAETAVHLLHESPPPEEVFEYFAGEVCSRMDSDLLDFLVKTSFLPNMTPHSAGAISKNSEAGRILSELNRSNCFTEKRSLREFVYQYHPLFREFLLSRADQTLAPEEIKQLRCRAAELLVESGEMEDAIELLLDAGAEQEAARLVLQLAPAMTAGGRGQTLEAWLYRLPESIFSEMPWLSYWRGVCQSSFAPGRALLSFQRAFQRFKAQDEETGALFAWSGLVDAILLERDNLRRLDAPVEWLEKRLERDPSFSSREIESRVVASMVGVILFRHAGHPRTRRWIERAAALVEAHPDMRSGITPAYLIMYYLVVGDTEKAALLIKMLEPSVSSSSPPLLRIMWNLIQAMHAHMASGAGEECIHFAEKGLVIATETGIHVFDLYLLAQRVHGYITMNDLRTAEKHLGAMAFSLKGDNQWDLAHYHFLSGWKDLCEGNARSARDNIQVSLRLVQKIGCNFSVAVGHIGLAHAYIEMKAFGKAETHIVRARRIISGNGDICTFICLIAEAYFWLCKSDEAKGTELLGKAMVLGRKQGFFNTPLWREPLMSLLCTKALEEGIEIEYVQEIIRRRNHYPVSQRGDERGFWVENWPYRVKIHTLGRFEIEVDGKTLEFSGKIQKKPLDLLKILIASGGRDIPAEQITEVVFPDADGDRAHYSFKFALHQLRKLLGSENLVLMQGGQLSLDARYCCTDVQAFLDLCRRVEGVLRQNGRVPAPAGEGDGVQQILQFTEKAIGLYRGDFLERDGAAWAVAARERIRRKFIRLVDVAGVCYEKTGRHAEAIELYEKGADTDELQEHFYRRLMLCLNNMGRRAEALSMYKRCQKVLGARLGIEPSPETKAIYESMILLSRTASFALTISFAF